MEPIIFNLIQEVTFTFTSQNMLSAFILFSVKTSQTVALFCCLLCAQYKNVIFAEPNHLRVPSFTIRTQNCFTNLKNQQIEDLFFLPTVAVLLDASYWVFCFSICDVFN